MTSQTDRRDPDDVRQYARVLWRRRSLILLVTGIVVAVGVIFTVVQPSTYTASATVLVKPTPASGSTTTAPLQQPNMETEQALVTTSRSIAERVSERDTDLTASELADNVSAEVVPNTELLVISYRDRSPTVAARLAQAFARAYVNFRVNDAATQMAAAEAPIEARVTALENEINDLRHKAASHSGLAGRLRPRIASLSNQLAPLRQQLLDVQSNVEVARNSASIVSVAEVPTAASSPSRVRNFAISVAVGLLLGVALALLFERVDDRVGEPERLEGRLDVPVLTTIPRDGTGPVDADAPLELLGTPDSPVSESYRVLADTIVALAAGSRLRIVAVTSAVDAEEKSHASSNLAVALSELGKRVTLVEADLREPRIHRLFGLRNGAEVPVVDAPGSREIEHVVRDVGVPKLGIVTSPNTNGGGRRLQREEIARMCESHQRAGAEFVVLDAPPVLETADASVVARAADGVVIVVDDDAALSVLERAVSRLRQQDVRILGAVLTERGRSTWGLDGPRPAAPAAETT